MDIAADVRGQKLRSGPQNPGKNKHFGADVHDPRAVQKNFGQKNFGLNSGDGRESPMGPLSDCHERKEAWGTSARM